MGNRPGRIQPGKYRTRDGGIADVTARLNSGMWLGTVADMFNRPMTVEWSDEGRISPIYDSRWDLVLDDAVRSVDALRCAAIAESHYKVGGPQTGLVIADHIRDEFELHEESPAVALGRLGGKVGGKAQTEAKAAAARENGKLGGRPRKKPEGK